MSCSIHAPIAAGFGYARKEQLSLHSQPDDMSQYASKPSHDMNGVDSRPFDMRQISNALPASSEQSPFGNRRPSAQFNMPASAGLMAPYIPYKPQYGQQSHDPRDFVQPPQQQHYALPNAMHQATQYPYTDRPQTSPMQTQPPYNYGLMQRGYFSVDMRCLQQQFPTSYGPPAAYADPTHSTPYTRHTSGPMTIPSLPRGPPRKPKQSGYALWVGNIPPAATVTDLKDHFTREATADIQSLFLISKSNCAFVNCRFEAACVAAMNRFHDSRFHGVRLVCRLRRGSITSANTSPVSEGGPKTPQDSDSAVKSMSNGAKVGEPSDPIIVVSSPVATAGETSTQAVSPSAALPKVPEKFFIVKSLTLQDLEASVRNGIWPTQSQNAPTLNQAYNAAANVYLIFSANKSGEYFGYARMASPMTGEAATVGSVQSASTFTPRDGPQFIPTPATETAPRGHIVDDSARGTIFWEAELSEEEEASSANKESGENGNGQELGVPFKIEWISTARLPFHRTRSLRNPWNANKEVKIARDGTEVEPSIGKRLVQMFHRPAQMPHQRCVSDMPLLPKRLSLFQRRVL